MPGMLSEAQPAQAPSPVPGPQTPPVGNPAGAGTPLPGDSASGAGHQQPADASFEELRDQGIQKIYGENFDQMIEMFQSNGPEMFPRSMAVAVNSTLQFLEKENGGLAPEQAAEVGMDLMMKLLEDIIGGGVVPDVTLEQVQQAFPAILVMYADNHPNVSKEDIQALVQQVQKGVAENEGGPGASTTNPPPPGAPPGAQPPGAPPPQLNTGPRPPPGNTPVPPGVV